MNWTKRGFIYKPENEAEWWNDHAMAPAAMMYDNSSIRVYLGCWDENGIARIGYIDLDAKNPKIVKNISREPVLDIGSDGCFDDNGVFPGHVYKYDGKVYLYYTGFQKLEKIPFSNFGGLAISEDNGNTFKRVSKAPVLDRADEGLFTRAGSSVIVENGVFKSCYSVGSGWIKVAGKDRPVYEVNYIESKDGMDFGKKGVCIVQCNHEIEHGLGRPQIFKLDDIYYVFYTRRLLDYKYHMGTAQSRDLKNWERIDDWLSVVKHGNKDEFDSEMVYFPCVVNTGKKVFLFYAGNGYGRDGFGYAELVYEG